MPLLMGVLAIIFGIILGGHAELHLNAVDLDNDGARVDSGGYRDAEQEDFGFLEFE